MKVAVNGLSIDNHMTGIGYYSYQLINHLRSINEIDYSFFLQSSVDISGSNIIRTKNYDKSYKRILAEQLVLPDQFNKYDLVHFLDYSSPFIGIKVPFITTVHDLTYFKYPETFSYGSRKIKTVLAPLSIMRSARIIADSMNTKRDIIELFPETSEKIRVVYPGKPNFYEIKDKVLIEKVKNKYGIQGEYLLTIGTLEPRKNMQRLIEAFKELLNKERDIKLVIVGKKGWLYNELFEKMKESRYSDKVIITGYVEQTDIPALYSGAACFVYPSIYEGFGLPPLEAMCCGVPVVVSNTSSLPEVVGDAGVYVNPFEIDSISNGILRALNDNALRESLISIGYIQIKKFEWSQAARQIIDIYREILE